MIWSPAPQTSLSHHTAFHYSALRIQCSFLQHLSSFLSLINNIHTLLGSFAYVLRSGSLFVQKVLDFLKTLLFSVLNTEKE